MFFRQISPQQAVYNPDHIAFSRWSDFEQKCTVKSKGMKLIIVYEPCSRKKGSYASYPVSHTITDQ